MSNVYLSLAEAHEKLAAGYRALAAQGSAEAPSPVKQPEAPVPEPKKLAIEDVRAVMSAKADEGKTPQIKALLMKYDAGRLSGVDPARYPDLMRELEAL